MQWRSFPKPVAINDILADAVDFRFEDWQKGANPQKTSALYPKMNPTPFILGGSFSAPLWDGGYININNEVIPDVDLSRDQWNALRKYQQQPDVDVSEEPKYQRLPPHWFEFAALYLNGREVKEPEWPREGESAFRMAFQQTPTQVEPHGNIRRVASR